MRFIRCLSFIWGEADRGNTFLKEMVFFNKRGALGIEVAKGMPGKDIK